MQMCPGMSHRGHMKYSQKHHKQVVFVVGFGINSGEQNVATEISFPLGFVTETETTKLKSA